MIKIISSISLSQGEVLEVWLQSVSVVLVRNNNICKLQKLNQTSPCMSFHHHTIGAWWTLPKYWIKEYKLNKQEQYKKTIKSKLNEI